VEKKNEKRIVDTLRSKNNFYLKAEYFCNISAIVWLCGLNEVPK